MRIPLCKYFTVGNFGVRLWFRPSWWRWAIDRIDKTKTVYEFGPVTIYKGTD